jgi:hypothetical protein
MDDVTFGIVLKELNATVMGACVKDDAQRILAECIVRLIDQWSACETKYQSVSKDERTFGSVPADSVVDSLRAKIRSLKEDLYSRDVQIGTLREDVRSRDVRLKTAYAKVRSADADTFTCDGQNEKLTREKTALAHRLSCSEGIRATQIKVVKALRAENDERNVEASKLEDENDKLAGAAVSHEEVIRALRSDIRLANQTIVDYRNDACFREEQFTATGQEKLDRIAELEAELEDAKHIVSPNAKSQKRAFAAASVVANQASIVLGVTSLVKLMTEREREQLFEAIGRRESLCTFRVDMRDEVMRTRDES